MGEGGYGGGWIWERMDMGEDGYMEEDGYGRRWIWRRMDMGEDGYGRGWIWERMDIWRRIDMGEDGYGRGWICERHPLMWLLTDSDKERLTGSDRERRDIQGNDRSSGDKFNITTWIGLPRNKDKSFLQNSILHF